VKEDGDPFSWAMAKRRELRGETDADTYGTELGKKHDR